MVLKSENKIKELAKKVTKKVVLPFLTPVIVVSSSNEAEGSTIKNTNEAKRDNNKVYSPLPENSENLYSSNVYYERMIRCNINDMVCERADWLCREYVNAASRRLEEITRCTNKNTYVKKMFSRMGHGYKYDEYCLVAQLSAFKDVTDRTGNLQNVLPKSAGCDTFIKNLRNKGYGDCIRTNPAFNSMQPGDLVFIPRGKGKYHAVSIKKVWKDKKGKFHVLVTSFNNDHYYEISSSKSCIVVNMHKLVSKALWKELDAQGILPPGFEKGDVMQIIPLASYKQIKAFLTAGMEQNNSNTASNENTSEEKQLKVALHIIQAAKNNTYS